MNLSESRFLDYSQILVLESQLPKLFTLKFFSSQNGGCVNTTRSLLAVLRTFIKKYIKESPEREKNTALSWRDAQSCSVAHCPGKAFCPREISQASNQIIPTETAAKSLC